MDRKEVSSTINGTNSAESNELTQHQPTQPASFLPASHQIGAGNTTAGNLLPFLQQPGASLQLGGGFINLQPQLLNQQVGFNPLVNGLVGTPQNNLNPLYIQQLLAIQPIQTNPLLSAPAQSNASTFGQSNPLTISSNSFAPFPGIPVSNVQQNAISSAQARAPPSALQVQNALATIAFATNGPIPSVSLPNNLTIPKVESGEVNVGNARNSDGGHPPVIIYMEIDEESLSDYQCLLRKQIELFEATSDDVQWNAQGRNKAIVLGQVGIRCRYCARLATWARARGAVYYSATLDGLYQAAQNMAKNHLCKHCRLIPQDVRAELLGLRDFKRRAAGGKNYWAEGAKVLGVVQCENGLRFKESTTGRKKTSEKKAEESEPAS